MENFANFKIENGVLVKYTGNGGDVVIPEGVTSIGNDAFCGCHSLTSIHIPDSVTSIGKNAFWFCRSLIVVTFGENSQLTSIGWGAFYLCDSLKEIVIPESVTGIGYGVFFGCKSLTIYCEATSQPAGWSSYWNNSDCPVIWNSIKTLGGEKIAKVFVDEDSRLNIFTENPIKEVKKNKIGDLPKETIYFGERDGLCSCQRKPKDYYETRWLTERFFNEILDNEDQIILVKVNGNFRAIKLLKAFELLPDGWYINMCRNKDKILSEDTYCLSRQKDDFVEFYLNVISKNVSN